MFQNKICIMVLVHSVLYITLLNSYVDVTVCKYRYLVHEYQCSIRYRLLAKNVSTTSLLC